MIDSRIYTVEDGLSHRSVNSVFEDKDGYIWMGTQQGLNRFDGEKFESWEKPYKGFTFNNINRITQDDEGWIWIINSTDILCYHSDLRVFQSFEDRFGHSCSEWKKEITSSTLRYFFYKDKEDRLYLSTKIRGTYVTYHSSEGLVHHKIKSENICEVLSVDSITKNIYLTEYYRIVEVNPEGDIIRELEVGEKGKTGFAFISKEYGDYLEIDAPDGKNRMKRILVDKNFEIQSTWEVNHTRKNLRNSYWLYKTKEKEWEIYSLDDKLLGRVGTPEKLKKEQFMSIMNCFFEDSKGRIWIGYSGGLQMISVRESVFKSFFVDEKNKPFPRKNAVRNIYANEKDVYASLEKGGLVKADRISKDYTFIGGKNGHIIQIGLLRTDGAFYAGSSNEVLRLEDDGTETIFPKMPKAGNREMWTLLESGDAIWAGSNQGLYRRKGEDDAFVFFDSGDEILNTSHVLFFVKEKENKIWLCTNKGLFLFDTESEKILVHYSSKYEGEYHVPRNNIQHIHKEKENLYWLATTNGLVRWDRINQEFLIFDKSNHLPNNNVYGILEDEKGYLWMSTDFGLVQFHKKNYTTQIFNVKDGLPYQEFNRTSF
ncbi:MAG: ligand-binding sensor domain-containing protein, partial [Saprospiraceae bacterium]